MHKYSCTLLLYFQDSFSTIIHNKIALFNPCMKMYSLEARWLEVVNNSPLKKPEPVCCAWKNCYSKGCSILFNHFIDMRTTVSLSISCRKNLENFQQKHVFSTWNGQTNDCSHVYKMIEQDWTTFSCVLHCVTDILAHLLFCFKPG
jgi:hypothetical protein